MPTIGNGIDTASLSDEKLSMISTLYKDKNTHKFTEK
jgi:hypothetical protein